MKRYRVSELMWAVLLTAYDGSEFIGYYRFDEPTSRLEGRAFFRTRAEARIARDAIDDECGMRGRIAKVRMTVNEVVTHGE